MKQIIKIATFTLLLFSQTSYAMNKPVINCEELVILYEEAIKKFCERFGNFSDINTGNIEQAIEKVFNIIEQTFDSAFEIQEYTQEHKHPLILKAEEELDSFFLQFKINLELLDLISEYKKNPSKKLVKKLKTIIRNNSNTLQNENSNTREQLIDQLKLLIKSNLDNIIIDLINKPNNNLQKLINLISKKQLIIELIHQMNGSQNKIIKK